ncbi:MAG: MerR family transcriptional regulator [Ardenticatenaceae bacterium]
MTLRIGQLAKRVGMRTSTLRYYEQEGLLSPRARSSSGYRLYDESAEQTLRFIQRAQRLGFSLADIGILLKGWQTDDLSDEAMIATAEARYLALERQVTQLLVLQHELDLFLQDMHQKVAKQSRQATQSHFNRLLDHICTDPLTQPADSVLDWLVKYMGCMLKCTQGQQLLTQLRGQHVHIWQKGDDYHILVVSNDPAIGSVLEQLAQLEACCQAHTHRDQAPELMHNDEGYLFIARGDHAFIFARLFLALEQEGEGTP